MHGRAIAAQPLARDGLGLLTSDFGETRIAGLATVRRDSRAAAAEDDETARALSREAMRATRP